MPRVIHFEIPCNDPDAIGAFYTSVFGWNIAKWEGSDGEHEYWLVRTGQEGTMGIDGGLMRRQHPEQPVVNTMDVDNVDAYAEKVVAAGGEIVVPKMPVPGIGWLVYFKDPEGHVFGMMQMDGSVTA